MLNLVNVAPGITGGRSILLRRITIMKTWNGQHPGGHISTCYYVLFYEQKAEVIQS
jgi:hypothetical protein